MGVRLLLWKLTTFLAWEKILSEGTDIVCTERDFLAGLADNAILQPSIKVGHLHHYCYVKTCSVINQFKLDILQES